jgi:hypothetical protein
VVVAIGLAEAAGGGEEKTAATTWMVTPLMVGSWGECGELADQLGGAGKRYQLPSGNRS